MANVAISESEYKIFLQIAASFKAGFPQFRQPQRRRNTGGGAGGSSTVWATVTQMPEYDDPDKAKYIVQRASITKEAGNDIWQGDGIDIEIERAIGFEGYDSAALDIRNWAPWFEVGSIIRIVARETIVTDTTTTPATEKRQSSWLMGEPLIYGGDETVSSWRYNEDDNITQAVWA